MSPSEMPDDAGRTPAFGTHPADATVLRIAERLLAAPADDPIWREAAALNTARHPLDAARRRGTITVATYEQRLRVVAGPVLALANHRGSEVLMAATLLLQAEAAANPLPEGLN
jgi:hypothetical protein